MRSRALRLLNAFNRSDTSGIMQSSPLPVSPEKALLERMRTLYPQLHDAKCHTSEYEHLIARFTNSLSPTANLSMPNRASGRTDPRRNRASTRCPHARLSVRELPPRRAGPGVRGAQAELPDAQAFTARPVHRSGDQENQENPRCAGGGNRGSRAEVALAPRRSERREP